LAEAKKRIYVGLDRGGMLILFGVADENLRLIERALKISIIGKDNRLLIKGNRRDSDIAERVIEELKKRVTLKQPVSKAVIEQAIDEARFGKREPKKVDAQAGDGLLVSSKRDLITPKTANQREYIKRIFENQIVFGIGPAGTGKTYLATAAGLFFLREKKVERIILVRPVVEAGENLGFLPGDLKEKIDPYLRPLFDAIYDMIEPRIFHELVENEVI
jgi:phosphate starvation-inducible protein PhoH and related proteins